MTPEPTTQPLAPGNPDLHSPCDQAEIYDVFSSIEAHLEYMSSGEHPPFPIVVKIPSGDQDNPLLNPLTENGPIPTGVEMKKVEINTAAKSIDESKGGPDQPDTARLLVISYTLNLGAENFMPDTTGRPPDARFALIFKDSGGKLDMTTPRENRAYFGEHYIFESVDHTVSSLTNEGLDTLSDFLAYLRETEPSLYRKSCGATFTQGDLELLTEVLRLLQEQETVRDV